MYLEFCFRDIDMAADQTWSGLEERNLRSEVQITGHYRGPSER
jgi:hypothetical protein